MASQGDVGDLASLHEAQVATVLSFLSLKNIFAAKCTDRFINQIVCSGGSGSKVLFCECLALFLARTSADQGFLPNILATNLIQWATLGQTPALRSCMDNGHVDKGSSHFTHLTQRFLRLDSALACMLGCANLRQTKFGASRGLTDALLRTLPEIATWDNVRYYDASAATGACSLRQDFLWICQKYGATVSIQSPKGGKLELNFVASHEVTEVVEERVVYCSVSFPGAASSLSLLHTRSERWIEEENFTNFAPVVNLEEWKKLHSCFFPDDSPALSVALVFRLLSAPVTPWQLDNFRPLKPECAGKSKGLGRLNFEDRPTMLWLSEEFAMVAELLGSNEGLGTCPLDHCAAWKGLLD